MENLLLSTLDAAKVLSVSKSWLDHSRLDGSGPPHVRLGGRCFYRAQDLRDFVNARVLSVAKPRPADYAGGKGRGKRDHLMDHDVLKPQNTAPKNAKSKPGIDRSLAEKASVS